MITCRDCGSEDIFYRLKQTPGIDYRLCICRTCDYWWEEKRPHEQHLLSETWKLIAHGKGKFNTIAEKEITRLPLNPE